MRPRDIPEFYDQATGFRYGYTSRLIQFLEAVTIDANTTERYSEPFRSLFHELWLYAFIDSTTTGDQYMRLLLEALNERKGTWHPVRTGPLAAMFVEDVDTASGAYYGWHLRVTPRVFRVKVVGTNLSGAEAFTVTVYGELFGADVQDDETP